MRPRKIIAVFPVSARPFIISATLAVLMTLARKTKEKVGRSPTVLNQNNFLRLLPIPRNAAVTSLNMPKYGTDQGKP